MKNFVLLMGIALCVFPLTAQTRQQVDLFSLNQVRLLESPFLSAQQTDLRYLLALEPDRLLSPFLREAGLQPKAPSYPIGKYGVGRSYRRALPFGIVDDVCGDRRCGSETAAGLFSR